MTRHFPVTVLLVVWSLSGCLTVENKEYYIMLATDHSGQATIKFLNIVSETDDTIDVSDDDFQQLIGFYLEGTQLEAENPGFRNVRKQLYEEDGMLVGEVTFDFDSLSVLRLYKFDEDSPFMYFVGSLLPSELLVETNGSFGRDWMPVVFWENDTRELRPKSHRKSYITVAC